MAVSIFVNSGYSFRGDGTEKSHWVYFLQQRHFGGGDGHHGDGRVGPFDEAGRCVFWGDFRSKVNKATVSGSNLVQESASARLEHAGHPPRSHIRAIEAMLFLTARTSNPETIASVSIHWGSKMRNLLDLIPKS